MYTKNKFFLWHLSASILIGLLSAYIVFFIWYPAPLAKAIGVTHLFGLLLIIDVILGPLLGWIVYKESKKTLRFDLSIIILVQIIAYSYGMYSVAQGRPLWIVYSQYHFDVVQSKQIDELDRAKAAQQYRERSLLGVQYVALKDDESYKKNDVDYQRRGWTSYPANYTKLSLVQLRMAKMAFDLKYLNQTNDPQQVAKVLKQHPSADGWFPLKAPMSDMVVLVDKTKGEVVEIANLKPLR
ncbi:TfpX/TfpZ family type IV pilin accessory protein [Acinetobacter sp. A1-4-2]|uniref:TfpX/TfpZ family type IV pilin accessory protein n=1 Tax=Acinetobacter sp. A1-4-2 TaxID=3156489 RepID=A0AAU7SXQ7_9GAMM